MKRPIPIILCGGLLVLMAAGLAWFCAAPSRSSPAPGQAIVAAQVPSCSRPAARAHEPASAGTRPGADLLDTIALADLQPAPTGVAGIITQSGHNLPFQTASTSLSKEDAEIAGKLLDGLVASVERIDSLECDLRITDSAKPSNDMSGHLSSNKIDTFTFKGKIMGNTIDAVINCREDAVFQTVSDDQTMRSQDNLGAFELRDNTWLTSLRKQPNGLRFFERLQENQTVKDVDGKERTCTVLLGPQVTMAFESSTGRLVQVESKHPDQVTITRLVYDKDSTYPKSTIITYPGSSADAGGPERVVRFDYDNLQLRYKEGNAPVYQAGEHLQ